MYNLSWNRLAVILFLNFLRSSAFRPLAYVNHYSSLIPSSQVGYGQKAQPNFTSRSIYIESSALKMNKKDDTPREIDFDNLGKPIDIDTLISTDAAGPMYNICSNTGLQAKANNEEEMHNLGESIIFNKSSTFLDLEPNNSLDKIGTVPLFTDSIIFFIVFILLLECLLRTHPQIQILLRFSQIYYYNCLV